MPASSFRRVDLDLIHPGFLAKVMDMIAELESQGHSYLAYLGTRTMKEQDELYAQGRTRPGKIVTAAKGGESAHNFGLAFDFMATNPVSFDVSRFTPLVEACKKFGLHNGSSYKDYGHVSLPGYVTAKDLKPLLDILQGVKTGRLVDRFQGVWKYVDSAAT